MLTTFRWNIAKKLRGLLVCGFGALTVANVVHGASPEASMIITGGSDALQENMQAHVVLPAEDCDVSLLVLQRRLPGIRRSLVEALNALGYYHGKLQLAFSAGESCWQLEVQVEPGEPVLLRNVRIEVEDGAESQSGFERLLESTPLQAGSSLHHGEYEQLKSRLSNTAAESGYFDARFTSSEIIIDLQARVADLDLVFAPGERYRFGELRVQGNGILSAALINELLPVKAGDPYSADSLVAMRSALEVTQYFREISLRPLLSESTDKQVPVDISLQLRPRHAWTSGLGFTTDTGPRARLFYENRFINSRGHRLSADSSLSGVRGQINTSYIIPMNIPLADNLILSAGFVNENNDAYKSKRWQSAVALQSENPYGWQQTLQLEVQRDDYAFDSFEDVALLVMPGIGLSKTRADNLIFPQHGWRLQAELKGASDSLLSDTSFVQLFSSAKLVQSIGPMRVLARAELGATWIPDTNELPASLRYFAGGDQSVRGFDFRALGPLDSNGEVIGGSQLAVAGLELDFPLKEKWRLAVFTDMGNAFNDRNDFELRYSAGIGIRWLSPIGPIRLDLAHPFDTDESFRIHITMGPDL